MNVDNRLLVAAFDFGTTYSGYVFSFRDKPKDFYSPQAWQTGSKLISQKTPTCLLLNPNKSFLSFGYDAQNAYARLAEKEGQEHAHYYYFEGFKMVLHHEKYLNRNTEIKDITGKPIQAMIVFIESIRYLMDHLLRLSLDRGFELDVTDIQYVLTVPAIWSDSAKMFMREAAIKAGIPNTHLTLALEPEAASIYCQEIPVDRMGDGQGFSVVQPGTQYIVADLGGGTADFTVHEKEEGGTLKELCPPSGGPWGGISVDYRYLKLMEKLIGTDEMENWKLEEMEDYYDMIRDFEFKKRQLSTASQTANKTAVRIPAGLKGITEAIQNCGLGDKIDHKRGKLNFNVETFLELFDETVDRVVEHTKSLVRMFPNVKHILMVGGFSECNLVREKMRKEIGAKVVVPNECEMAVLRGAVLYGHRPEVISQRILRYTYGEARNVRFQEGVHPPDRKYMDKRGVARCRQAFHVIAKAGTPVPSSGRVIEQLTQPTYDDSNKTTTHYYYSTSPDVLVIDDTCHKLGTITVYHPPNQSGELTFQERYTFGGTESKVEILNRDNGQMVEFTFELL